RLPEAERSSFTTQRRTAECSHELAQLLRRRGYAAEALPLAQENLTRWDRLVRRMDPGLRQTFVVSVAHATSLYASLLSANGQLTEAISGYRQAAALYRELAAHDPSSRTYRRGLGNSLHAMARCLSEAGRPSEALPLFEEAISVRRRLATTPQ